MSAYDDITIDNDASLVPVPGPRHVRPEGQPARSWPLLPDTPRVGLVFAPEPLPGVLTEELAHALRELFSKQLHSELAKREA